MSNYKRIGHFARVLVTDRDEFLRRYQRRFETIDEVEPGTELYVVGIPSEPYENPEEANAVYFFEVFPDEDARQHHFTNPDGLEAKSLWWDDLLLEGGRAHVNLDYVWAKGMSTVGSSSWLEPFPGSLSAAEEA